MNDYISLGEYNSNKLKDLKISYIYFLVIVFISIFLFFIFVFIKIDNYYINDCIVKEDLLVCTIKYDEMKYLVNNNELYIDNDRYSYEIYSIGEDFTEVNDSYYKEVNLSISLKDNNIDNNVLKIKIRIYRSNLFDYLKEIIGGNNEKN